MSLFPPGIIADLRAQIDSTLTDTATNSRTGRTRGVCVIDGKREERIQGLPTYIRLRRWDLRFSDGDLVRVGDQETVPGKGIYDVQVVTDPVTLSASVTAICLMQLSFSGDPAFSPIVTNQTVTLANPTGDPVTARMTIPVYIYPARDDILIRPEAAGYEWAAVWADARYPNGTRPRAGHTILWNGLEVPASQKIKISKPRRYFSPVPFSLAYFLEP